LQCSRSQERNGDIMDITSETLELKNKTANTLNMVYNELESMKKGISKRVYDSLLAKYNEAYTLFQKFNKDIVKYKNDNDGAMEILKAIADKIRVFVGALANEKKEQLPSVSESVKKIKSNGIWILLAGIPLAMFALAKRK